MYLLFKSICHVWQVDSLSQLAVHFPSPPTNRLPELLYAMTSVESISVDTVLSHLVVQHCVHNSMDSYGRYDGALERLKKGVNVPHRFPGSRA